MPKVGITGLSSMFWLGSMAMSYLFPQVLLEFRTRGLVLTFLSCCHAESSFKWFNKGLPVGCLFCQSLNLQKVKWSKNKLVKWTLCRADHSQWQRNIKIGKYVSRAKCGQLFFLPAIPLMRWKVTCVRLCSPSSPALPPVRDNFSPSPAGTSVWFLSLPPAAFSCSRPALHGWPWRHK